MIRPRLFLWLSAVALLVFSASSNGRTSRGNVQTGSAAPSSSAAPQSPPSSTTGALNKSAVDPGAEKSDASGPAAAWQILADAASSPKFRDRSDAISALTILPSDRRAVAVLIHALSDKDETIRVLAVTSLGEMKAQSAIPQLKDALDDKSPEVSFAAAQALWKMGDRSGRDIFYDVLAGERKVKPGLIKSKMRQARNDMHDPKALALIGVNEVSGAFLGPFSMGVSAVEEYAKNNGTSVQALCAQLLAADNSPQTRDELRAALSDKNWTVRAAATRSIAKLGYRGTAPELRDMMLKDKAQLVRFAAAAAIIHLRLGSPLKGTPPVSRISPSRETSGQKSTLSGQN